MAQCRSNATQCDVVKRLRLPYLDQRKMYRLICDLPETLFGQLFAREDGGLVKIAEVHAGEPRSWVIVQDGARGLSGSRCRLYGRLLGDIEVLDVVSRIALGVGLFEQSGQLVAFSALPLFGRARCSADIESIEACRGVQV